MLNGSMLSDNGSRFHFYLYTKKPLENADSFRLLPRQCMPVTVMKGSRPGGAHTLKQC